MENHERFDDELKKLVQSVGRDIPPAVEETIRAAAAVSRPLYRHYWLRRPLVMAALAGSAVILTAFIFMFPSFHRHPKTMIAEIRTEFDLADKDIKIIFVQKPDFPVLVTAF